MALTWYINGTDLSTHKIVVAAPTDSWRSGPSISRAIATVPGRLRSYLSRIDQVAARTFELPFQFATYTVADRQTEEEWLKQYLRQSITVKWTDGTTTRELVGTLDRVRLNPIAYMNNTAMDGSLVITCPYAAWQATSDTTLGSLGASDTSIVMGNAPCEDWSLAITVSGGSDPRTITVTIKNGSGTTLNTLAWTGTLGANTLTISALLGSVKNNTTDTTSAYTGGFPVIDPKDSPTIRVASSSGTATGVLTHRKRYY